MASTGVPSGGGFEFALFAAPGFEKSVGKLGDRRVEAKVYATLQRLRRRDPSPGLNNEHLHRIDADVESRSARITNAHGAPRLIFAQQRDEIVALWADRHDAAYKWESHNLARIPGIVARKAPLGLDGAVCAPPVPRASPTDPIRLPDPDLLDEAAAHGYEAYFAALDDDQRFLVEYDARERKGLTFVPAGAGTGKTAIAIRRALHRAQQPELCGGRVLYLCYNRALMLSVRRAIDALAAPEAARQIETQTVHGWAEAYLQRREQYAVPKRVDLDGSWLASVLPAEVARLSDGDRAALARTSMDVLENEIAHVLGPNQFGEVEAYLDLTRPESQGLQRLRRPQRAAVWALHQRIRARADALDGWDDMIERARAALAADPDPPRYRDVIVDEAQDCSPVMARLAKALVAGEEWRLLVLADPAQALYAGSFIWARREFRTRVRQNVLLRPYRSTRQIHALADSLYAGADTVRRELPTLQQAEREGPLPRLARAASERQGLAFVVEELRRELAEGGAAGQTAVLTGTNRRRDEAAAALRAAGVPVHVVSREAPPDGASVSLATVHAAKGLDFASVYLLDPVRARSPIDHRRAQLYVALTRSSRTLCIVHAADPGASLYDDLDDECCERVTPPVG